MARKLHRSPLIYVVAGASLMALLLVAVRVISPPAPSMGDGEAVLVSSPAPDREVVTPPTERGIFSQSLINSLGPTFGPLYEPGYVPEGYVPQGSPYAFPTRMERVGVGIAQIALNNQLITPYMNRHCHLSVHQHRHGSGQGPNIARRAIEYPSDTVVDVTPKRAAIQGYRAEYVSTHGIELYVGGPVLMAGVTVLDSEREHIFTQYWFEHEGTWFNIDTIVRPDCDAPSLNEIARIANSLEPVGAG